MKRANFTLTAIIAAAGVVTVILVSVDSSWMQMKFNSSNWVKETCSKWLGKLITDEELTRRLLLPRTVVFNGQLDLTTGTAVLLCQAHGAMGTR